MVACATVLPPTNSLSLAVQGAGFASGALASAWLGKGRGAGSLTTSSLVMSEAKKVVRVGLCGELQLGGLVCSFGCCARKQDRKGDQVQECRVILTAHARHLHLLHEHLQLDLLRLLGAGQGTRDDGLEERPGACGRRQAVSRSYRIFRGCPSPSAHLRISPRTSNRPHNGLKLPAPGMLSDPSFALSM